MLSISVVIPARNEWDSIVPTVHSIAFNRRLASPIQIVIVDDHSRHTGRLEVQQLRADLKDESVELVAVRTPQRLGVAGARNLGARRAQGDILFFTDGHVTFTQGWDDIVSQRTRRNRILAATIRDTTSSFAGFGCDLVVPFMGTHWVREPRRHVQVAASAGTVVHRSFFFSAGGYDEGMLRYGGIEPEFSVRAWLAGGEIVSVPELEVYHRFKPSARRNRFIAAHRLFMVHNSLRFGILYLNRRNTLQMLRHYALQFPAETREAFGWLATSDVWQRRDYLAGHLPHDFDWFVRTFDLHDQIGRSLA